MTDPENQGTRVAVPPARIRNPLIAMVPGLVRVVLYASSMPIRRAVIAVAAVLVSLGIARGGAAAQPSQSPLNTPPSAPAPAPVEAPRGSYKSPDTALALSLGGTIGSLALVSVAGATDNDALGTAGALGVWLAPSFGHWYAGKGWTTGLKWRLAGAGAATLGIMWIAVDCIGSGCGDMPPGAMLAIGGGVAFVGGMVHDIATAPRAAREHNARLEGRIHDVAVRPIVGGDRVGVALSGRF